MSRPPKSRTHSSGAASRRARSPWAMIAVALVISAALAMAVLEFTAPRPKLAPTMVSIIATPRPPAAPQTPAPAKAPDTATPPSKDEYAPHVETPPIEPLRQDHAALPSPPLATPATPSPAPAPTAPPPTVTVPPPAVAQLPDDALPAWKRYAIAAPRIGGRPMIAVVIDDMGLDQRRSAEVVALPAPLTLSYLPYGRDLARQTQAAHRNGHELMLHIPMQPQGTGNNPGPNALTTDLTPAEIKHRLDQALAAFDGYVGINNHMGSLFTVDRARMDVVMAELKARGLLFLDSRTVQRSVGISVADAHDVPSAGRNVFLDNEISAGEVTHQLAETERIARQGGLAIAIGHPHDVTIAALKAWLPTLQSKGFAQVPVSAVVARLEARRTAPQTTAVPSQP
jgi:uncharacterized protein